MGFGRLLFPIGIVLLSLLSPSKVRASVVLGIRAASHLGKAKILVKKIQILSIFQAGLTFKLDVPLTLGSMGQAL